MDSKLIQSNMRGQKMFLLRDRIGYAPESLVFSPAVVSILANMNGGNSLRDLQADFMRQTGQLLYMEELQNLVKTLDEHLFLDNDRFRSLAAKEISEFLDSPVRKMRHAGRSYPAGPGRAAKKTRFLFQTRKRRTGLSRSRRRTPREDGWPRGARISILTRGAPVLPTPTSRLPKRRPPKPG